MQPFMLLSSPSNEFREMEFDLKSEWFPLGNVQNYTF